MKQVFSVKGKKDGTGGRMARFFVAIAYGKGVIVSHQYEEHVNGVPEVLYRGNNNRGKLFIQDGNPSENCRKIPRRFWFYSLPHL